LRALGFEAGDRLGLCVATSEPLLHVLGGASRAGVVPVVANVQLMPAERELIRADADVRMWVDNQGELERLLDGPPAELAPFPLVRPMHYTSGTTGRPKGVWSGVLSEQDAERLWREDIDQWQLGSGDVHLVCSPLQHSAPIRFALSTLLVAARCCSPDRSPWTVRWLRLPSAGRPRRSALRRTCNDWMRLGTSMRSRRSGSLPTRAPLVPSV